MIFKLKFIKFKSKLFSMKHLTRYVVLLLLLTFCFYSISFLNLNNFTLPNPSKDTVESFELLKSKIDYLQNLVDSKQNDINNLKDAFATNVVYYNDLIEKQKLFLEKIRNNSYSYFSTVNSNTTDENSIQEIKSLLFKLNLTNYTSLSSLVYKSITNLDVEFKDINELLPHLNGLSQYAIQPKFKQSKNRFASIVIGIPTIKRDKTSYLLETLKSIFDAMNELEKTEAIVVVFIPELDDHSFVQTTIENLNRAYKYELDSGLMEIVVPPTEFYPNFTLLPDDRVFNDSRDRVKWRTKQNYDFSYMMTYCQKRGAYYLQLEDDVVAKSGFFTTIKNFIGQQKTNEWMIIEFSQLGFIGKLFKCAQLKYFVNFFLMFANDKPVDWLFDIMLDVKICNPDKPSEHCLRSKGALKIRYKPSLFQHVGIQSSLKGKTQKLKDKDFGKTFLTIVAHDNPPAKISTSLKTYMKYTIESVYQGNNYFWSMSPAANDFILFEFEKPSIIKKYYIKSGNPEHPEDKLYNATLHIKTQQLIPNDKVPKNYARTSDDFYIIDTFSSQLGIVSGKIDPNITGLISQVRIHIPNKSDTWIIISEIDLSSKDSDIKVSSSVRSS